MKKAEFVSTNKNGIFLFHTNSCSICKKQVEQFPWNVKHFYLIDCDEDVNYYIEEEGLDDMPCTRIYKDNVVVWEKHGLFQRLQFEELNENYNENKV